MGLLEIRNAIKANGNSKKAKILQRFFKTGSGEYGEGDVFLGLTMPKMRAIAKQAYDLSLKDIQSLLQSKIHEERTVSLLILCYQFERGNGSEKKKIYSFYLKNTQYVNNWDLVDSSASVIVGGYLHNKGKGKLEKLAQSKSLWERRIAIIATYYFIKQETFAWTLKIATELLHDEHDLIHKAVGWMLREVGNRDLKTEEKFLKKHYKEMPRTMLRYAIEKFPETKRQAYLKGRM